MNLGQFRELTKDLPDDTKLFKEGNDPSSLVTVEASTSLVFEEQDGQYTYWYLEDYCAGVNVFTGVIIG